MTECLMTSVRNEATPAEVLRNLNDFNLLSKNETDKTFTTGEDCEPYIAHHIIDDKNEDKEPRATIRTSKKLLGRIKMMPHTGKTILLIHYQM